MCGGLVFEYLSLVSKEKAMAPHSSTLAWKIPWTEEPGGFQSIALGESSETTAPESHLQGGVCGGDVRQAQT